MSFNSNNILDTPIEYLKGVGPIKGDLLRKELDIFTFGDLLEHYPFRYVDRTKFVQIQDINAFGDNVQIIAKVVQMNTIGEGFKKRLMATVRDESGGEMELVWFQGIAWVQKQLMLGDIIIIFGKAVNFNGNISITHPDFDKFNPAVTQQLSAMEPVYNTTEKLKVRGVNSKVLHKLIQTLLPQIKSIDVVDVLPLDIITANKLINKYTAILQIHLPKNTAQQESAIYRLKFEELFLQQMNICKTKINREKVKGFVFSKIGDNFNDFYKKYLPFLLTDDQKKVIKEIRESTITGYQMNRLLQGDVGSGKTIVALICMLFALDNNFQACLVAPTEILSQQHFVSISELLKDMNINVQLLTGNVKGKDRKKILADLESGEIQILIGTHALFEDKVIFKNLGLAIVDEQHRFGVEQRSKLWKKNILAPHILVMTATPIPRTLTMTTYGDLDVSTIEHLPPGRKPIQTIHRNEIMRAKVMDFVKIEVQKGRQAYIVYPLIEESETLDYENLMMGFEQVKQFFPEHSYKISMVHGKQSMQEREINMQRFITGDTQIMVATTVIEVGVNVPNASVMLIESAERFGLSQLHQLRGRVGRGSEKSYCILLTGPKISRDGKERMMTMVNEINGFKIAEKDLELRGPGEINGTRQSGINTLKIADLVQDVHIIEIARESVLELIHKDPNLLLPENRILQNYLARSKNNTIWGKIS